MPPTPTHADRIAMGKAGKARKAGKTLARNNAATNARKRQRATKHQRVNAMLLKAAVATLASPDVPTRGRPANATRVYALDMVRPS